VFTILKAIVLGTVAFFIVVNLFWIIPLVLLLGVLAVFILIAYALITEQDNDQDKPPK
jgi:Flp pilus assembly protein TadB